MRRTHRKARLLEILLVEDSAADVRLLEELLKEGRLANRLTVLPDGDSALAYLRGRGGYAGTVKPDLVLLDLNLPGLDGRKVLEEIRRDPLLSRLPVAILSTSSSPEDSGLGYDLGAVSYLVKPPDLGQLIRAALCVENFRLALVAEDPPPGRKGGR